MSMDIGNALDALENRRAQAIVQAIEAAVEVRRRYQFFTWTQGSLQTLLPHKIAICGFYERAQKQVRLEMFNSVVVPAPMLTLLTDGQSALMQYVVNAWINNRGKPLAVRLQTLSPRAFSGACDALLEADISEILVHGVSRPQRANEIETIFMFASPGVVVSAAHLTCAELLLPHLHSTYLRVQSIERESGPIRVQPALSNSGYSSASISEREEQVLCWVREGLSNQAIGTQLGISPLTVKNHVQKILRKLGATNRAQAVARAMSMNLLMRPATGTEAIGK